MQNLDRTLNALFEKRLNTSDRKNGFFIGIGGGSASGKTTVAQQMQKNLNGLNVLLINQDRFFKPPKEMPPYWSTIYGEYRPDYNQPDSFYVDRMIRYCQNVNGADVAILEGILVLHFPELRDLMDLKLFIHADPDERIIRRIKRNLARWSYDEITNYYLESVRYQHQRFCEPTRAFADLVIPGGRAHDAERNQMVREICGAIREHLSIHAHWAVSQDQSQLGGR